MQTLICALLASSMRAGIAHMWMKVLQHFNLQIDWEKLFFFLQRYANVEIAKIKCRGQTIVAYVYFEDLFDMKCVKFTCQTWYSVVPTEMVKFIDRINFKSINANKQKTRYTHPFGMSINHGSKVKLFEKEKTNW